MNRLLLGLLLSFSLVAAAPAAETIPAPSESLVRSLLRQAPGLRPSVLKLALNAAHNAAERGLVTRNDRLTVIE